MVAAGSILGPHGARPALRVRLTREGIRFLHILFALVFATLLFEQPKGWRFYRFSLFLPYILAVPVVGVIFSYLLTLNGALNEILRARKLDVLALDWLGNPGLSLKTVLEIIIWKEMGFGIVLFFARLMSVSEEIYDHHSTPDEVRIEVLRQAQGLSSGFVVANGSPITPGTPEENVDAMIRTVKGELFK